MEACGDHPRRHVAENPEEWESVGGDTGGMGGTIWAVFPTEHSQSPASYGMHAPVSGFLCGFVDLG